MKHFNAEAGTRSGEINSLRAANIQRGTLNIERIGDGGTGASSISRTDPFHSPQRPAFALTLMGDPFPFQGSCDLVSDSRRCENESMNRCLRQLRAELTLAAALAVSGAATVAASAPSAWIYRAWQTEEGLPDISITDVAQTTDGYLWVATKGGLACFNGQRFSTVPLANFPEMPSRAVRAMFRDHRDWLWLGMERGPVLCLKPDGLQSFTTQDGLFKQTVLMMVEDREGAVWIVYPTQLRRILNGQAKPIALPADWRGSGDLRATSDVPGNIWCAKGTDVGVWREDQWQSHVRFKSLVTAISAGRKSHLWIAAGGQIFRLQEGQSPVEVAQLPPKVQPTVLMEDLAGALWIGTSSEGLFRWQENELQPVPTSQQEIICLFQDREENILAGTAGGGLNLIRPRSVELIGREAGLPFESMRSVSEDSDGWLWAAAQSGQLARHRNGISDALVDARRYEGETGEVVLDIAGVANRMGRGEETNEPEVQPADLLKHEPVLRESRAMHRVFVSASRRTRPPPVLIVSPVTSPALPRV